MSIFYNDLILKNILDRLELKDILSLYQTGNSQLRHMIQEWFSNTTFLQEQMKKMYLSCIDTVMEEDPDLFIRYFEPYGYSEDYYFQVHEKHLNDVLIRFPHVLRLLGVTMEDAMEQVVMDEISDLPLKQSELDEIEMMTQQFYEDLLQEQKKEFKKYFMLLSENDLNQLVDEIESKQFKKCVDKKNQMLNEIMMNWN